MTTYIEEEPFALQFQKSSINTNMSISISSLSNRNWSAHVVRNGVALDNINDSSSLLVTMARAMGL